MGLVNLRRLALFAGTYRETATAGPKEASTQTSRCGWWWSEEEPPMIMRTISEKYLYRWLYIPSATTRYYSSAHFPSFEHDDATKNAKRLFSNWKNRKERLTQGTNRINYWSIVNVSSRRYLLKHYTVCSSSGIKRITTRHTAKTTTRTASFVTQRSVDITHSSFIITNCAGCTCCTEFFVVLKLRCLGQGR